jgi:hypothetical protein
MVQRQHFADPLSGHDLEAHGVGQREVLVFVALEPLGDRAVVSHTWRPGALSRIFLVSACILIDGGARCLLGRPRN